MRFYLWVETLETIFCVPLLLNYLAKRYLPKVYAVLTGGRA